MADRTDPASGRPAPATLASSAAARRVRLALADDSAGPFEPALWIGPLLALGTRAARYLQTLSGNQLVIAISVPARDFAAVLIGCGWMLASPAPHLEAPLTVIRGLARGTPVRMVTDRVVITGQFYGLDEDREDARLSVGGSHWNVAKIRALAALPDLDESEQRRQTRPTPGSVSRMAGLAEEWEDRICRPPADLAIVGTRTWLREEVAAYIARGDGSGDTPEPDKIADILLPAEPGAATWSTRLYSAARFAEEPALPDEFKAVVLDGPGAIKYVSEIEAPVVFAVLDRSIADESAAEILVQLRNTRGEPLSVRDDLGWPAPAGIEALGFTVPL